MGQIFTIFQTHPQWLYDSFGTFGQESYKCLLQILCNTININCQFKSIGEQDQGASAAGVVWRVSAGSGTKWF